MSSEKAKMFVIPAKAGSHSLLIALDSGLRRNDVDSCFRWNDEDRSFSTFYEAINYCRRLRRDIYKPRPWPFFAHRIE